MPNKAVKIIPSASDNSPLANGLPLVLSTSRSYLWSRRSLIAQPSDLVRNEPKTTIVK